MTADARLPGTPALDVVTNRYTVIQNREALAFLANLLGSELAFETAGSLHGGKRVFVTCRLASIDHVEVGGDQVDLYVNFFNRHDGAGAVHLLTTPIRTVCRNTWDTAVGTAVNTFSIRHVGSPSTRIAEAPWPHHRLRQTSSRSSVTASPSRRSPSARSSRSQPNCGPTGTDRQIRNAQARREAVLRLFSEGATPSATLRTPNGAPRTG